MSPLRHRSVFGAKKRSKRPTPKSLFFRVRRQAWVPEPPNSLVFGRNRAPDARCAQDSAFCPEKQANSIPLSLSPFATALSPLAFGLNKCAKAAQFPSSGVAGTASRKFVFSCQTASGMPEPQVSLVFGRKQAPDAHFAQDSAFSARIPSRRACHRLSPLRHRSLLGRKVRKSGQVPERTSFLASGLTH